jgi:predicted neutral ceramidase superfamily lipid hydrolase
MNIEFGFARRNINPERPCSLAGYFNERIWDKILDDLEVRAFTLKYGNNYFSIVQFDLVSVTQTLTDEIYKRIENSDTFSKESMIITATHTHTAPEIRKNKPGFDPEYEKIGLHSQNTF